MALFLLGSRGLYAHDFWIAPSTFLAPTGTLVSVALREGEHGVGKPVPRMNNRIARFVDAGPTGACDIAGIDGADPAGFIRLAGDGTHILVYQSTPNDVMLQPALFEQYLWQEGLQHVIQTRHAQGQREQPGREGFRRCAKSLIRTQAGMDGGFDRVVGLPLEIIPESDPWAIQGRLRFRLLFEGQPITGVQISALRIEDSGKLLSARTDGDGRVELALDKPGRWLIKGVHMIPAPAGDKIDWESYWASVFFERAE